MKLRTRGLQLVELGFGWSVQKRMQAGNRARKYAMRRLKQPHQFGNVSNLNATLIAHKTALVLQHVTQVVVRERCPSALENGASLFGAQVVFRDGEECVGALGSSRAQRVDYWMVGVKGDR